MLTFAMRKPIGRLHSALAGAIAILAAAACGNDGPRDTLNGVSIATPSEQTAKFCDEVVAPFCDALFACCTDPQRLAKFGGSVAACNTQFAASCKSDIADAILPTVKLGATVLDEIRLAACVNSLRSMKSGGAACVRPPLFVVESDCVAAFRGQLASGATCEASALHDMEFVPCKAGACKAGTCNAFLANGAACDPSTNNTAAAGCNFPDGYTCSGTGNVGTCKPRAALGEACDIDSSGFSCLSMSCGGPGATCSAPTGDQLCSGG